MNNKVYLISVDDVKAISQINYNVEDSVVATAIHDAQNIYLRELLGDKLLERLQELVAEGGLDEEENAAYLDLLDNYVVEFLAYKANVEICLPISFKIRNMGVVQDYDANIQAASINNIEELRDYYETQACDKWNRTVCFLLENKKAFPELNECGCSYGCKSPHLIIKVNTGLQI